MESAKVTLTQVSIFIFLTLVRQGLVYYVTGLYNRYPVRPCRFVVNSLVVNWRTTAGLFYPNITVLNCLRPVKVSDYSPVRAHPNKQNDYFLAVSIFSHDPNKNVFEKSW